MGQQRNSTAGEAAGDAIYVSHESIDKFSIRKDYNAKIYGGGGGGGGGDRFLAEKIFAIKSKNKIQWRLQHLYGRVEVYSKVMGQDGTMMENGIRQNELKSATKEILRYSWVRNLETHRP